MQAYKQATNRLLEGLISEDPSVEVLRNACLECEKLTVAALKIDKLLKQTKDKEIIDAESFENYIKVYEECRLEVKSASEVVPLDVSVLDRAVRKSLGRVEDLLGELNSIVDSFKKKQREKEKEDSRLRKIEEDKLAAAAEAKEAAKRKAREEYEFLERIKREEEEKRVQLIKEAVSRGQGWRSGIDLYKKNAIQKLLLAILFSGLYACFLISWKAGPPVAILVILAAAVVGPVKMDGLVKNRLADNSGSLFRFDGWLAFAFIGGFGVVQEIVGLICTIAIGVFGKGGGGCCRSCFRLVGELWLDTSLFCPWE